MSHIITIPVTISGRTIDTMHALRSVAGLERVSDHVLAQIIFLAGIDAERLDLERLAEPGVA